MVVYVSVVMLNFFSGDYYYRSFPRACSEFAMLLFSSALGYYCFQPDNERTSKTIMWVLIIIISITSIMTFILDIKNPGILRQAASSVFSDNDMSEVIAGYKMGMSNYYLPHALPVLIPSLVLGIKNKELEPILRIINILVLLLVLILIFVSNAATPILIAMIILMVSIGTIRVSIKKSIFYLVFVSLIVAPMLINDNILVSLIDYICNHINEDSTFYYRLMDIEESIIYKEAIGDLDARLELYNVSSTGFLGSIVFGSNDAVGGHSAIIDRLATMGLVGFIPYFIFIWQQMKSTYKCIPNHIKIYYLEGVLAGVAMLLTKNMSNWEMWLMMFVLMPIITIQFGKEKQKVGTITE